MRFLLKVAVPLRIVFEKGFSREEVPRDWRLANVVPSFKNGGKKNFG